MRRWLAIAAAACAATGAGAQELGVSGSFEFELRPFFESSQFAGQFDGVQASGAAAPEFTWRSASRRDQFKVSPYLRVDGRDDERTHWDVREAFWRHLGGDFEMVLGVNRVFWGVTESRHLVDVINQDDAVEDIDGEDKLGQPMLQIAWQTSWGRLEALALFGFRERTFAGREGRLRAPLVVSDESLYPDGRSDVDLALRYSHYLGAFDVGVHLFHGTSREPGFVTTMGPGPRLTPLYRQINQLGVDLQYTRDAWLWKFEGIVREGEGNTFAATVFGFEYTLYQILGGVGDLGLLAEYLYDGRDTTAPATPFDNDLFVGARWALNDIRDTQILGGGIIDTMTGTVAARLEADRRLRGPWSLQLEAQLFTGVEPDDDLAALSQDSFATLRVRFSL